LTALAVALALPGAADDSYLLYWQVTDDVTIDGTAINDYVSTYAQTHNTFDYGYDNSGRIAGARTVFYDADGNGPTLMNIYTSNPWTDTGVTDLFIDDENMQVVGMDTGAYSHFTATTPEELSFAIELGNWENGEWVTLATSGTMSYSDLTVTDSEDGVHIVQMADGIDLTNFQPWTPTAYSVPEPSSGLLALIGAALLALRRRRC